MHHAAHIHTRSDRTVSWIVAIILGTCLTSYLVSGLLAPIQIVPTQEQVASELREHGCKVVCRELTVRPSKFWPPSTKAFVTQVQLESAWPIDAEIIPLLQHTPEIQTLALLVPGIHDADLRSIGKLSKLTRLILCGKTITDNGVSELERLRSLRLLTLRNTSITSKSLVAISQLKRLEHVNLIGGEITEENLEPLTKLDKLQNLYIFDTRISKADLRKLSNMKSTRIPSLSATCHGDESMSGYQRHMFHPGGATAR